MRDVQYYSKLRGFLSHGRQRQPHGAGLRRSSSFRLEPLEARVLLSADLAVAVKAPVIDLTVTTQQAVVQTVSASATASVTSGSINVGQATHEIGNAYWVTQNFGTAADSSTAPTASQLHIYENGIELGPAHSTHADIRTLGNGRFSQWQEGLYFSVSDNSNPMTNGRTYTYTVGTATAPAPSPTPAPTPSPVVGSTLNVGQATHEIGNAYWVTQNFGTAADSSTAPTASQLHIYENGIELGPAHSTHADVRTLGNGRFSQWQEGLYFSASDNSNPMTNGRTYTYTVGTATAPAPSPTPAPTPSPVVGSTLNVGQATHEIGNAYWVTQNFGTAADSSTAPTASQLHIYENGIELGPAHSTHADVRTLGNGRFSQWQEGLYFSASDNSNPMTNGRTYTYTLGTATAPTPSPTPAPTPSPVPSPVQTPPPSPIPSTGQVYYVAPGGSDSNAGTASSPWHSIQAAAQRLRAGETAILMNGTYEEGQISFANSGTAANPITIRAQNKWGAVLSSISGDNPAISISQSYITIQDLRISVSPNNAGGALSSANCAIRAWEGNTPTPSNPSTGLVGMTVRGVLVDASAQRSSGIKTNQDFSLVENCEIHSSLEAFNNTGSTFRNNMIYGGDAWGDALYGKGGLHNLQIYNNTVHLTNASGRGIFLGGTSGNAWVYDASTGYEAYNSTVHDNTILNESGSSSALTLGLMGTTNCTLQNNVTIGGGTLFQIARGSSSGGPYPMPTNSTILNNTFV